MVFVPAQKLSGIDLFQKRLSEKLHPPISKGTVGGFEFTVLQRKLKKNCTRGHGRVLKESNKSSFDSYSVWNNILIISHVTFRDYCVFFFFQIAASVNLA